MAIKRRKLTTQFNISSLTRLAREVSDSLIY